MYKVCCWIVLLLSKVTLSMSICCEFSDWLWVLLVSLCSFNPHWSINVVCLQPMFTCTPSAVSAEQAWTCHMRSRMVWRLRLSASSEAGVAVIRSCLLAKISSGTAESFSSSSNSASSWKNRHASRVSDMINCLIQKTNLIQRLKWEFIDCN